MAGGALMQEFKIKLWRHDEEKDWSVEVHGRLHEHVSSTTVDELVEYALVAAQHALLKPRAAGSCYGSPIPGAATIH
jgi:hypothetical protein